MDLTSLYTDIVFEHDKRPLHAGLREPYEAEVHHVNPTCGDEITLRVHLAGDPEDPRIEDVSYDATGCAMSRASASTMSDLVIGRTLREIEPVSAHMDAVMHARGREEGDEDLLGDAVALVGASKFPNRVKCVLMSWKALHAAVIEAGGPVDGATA